MAPRIAYLLKKFPRLSETFVLGEILGQEALGAEIHVFSRRAADDEPRHAELARLRAPVEVLPPVRELDLWGEIFDAGGELLAGLREIQRRLAPVAGPKLPALVAEAIWLRRRARELAIEHVHVHFATDSAMVAMLSRALGGPPFSVTAHAKDIYRDTVAPAQLAALLESSAFVVTVCEANVAHVRSLVGPRVTPKLRRLYNGIDVEAFAASPRAPRPGRVLSIGRLVEKKGFDVLVDALAELARRGVAFDAVIAGDGEDREKIAARVRERGLAGRVALAGAVPQARVRELLGQAQAFCLPCKVGDDGNRDALPTVLLEALAAGVPAVSTPVGGVAEILDGGRAGLLVPEGDPMATADALQRLLEDGALRDAIARAGAARASELFDSRRQSHVLRAWFQESVARSESPCASPA